MRDIRWLALVGVLGLLLAGCGGGDGDNASELSDEAEAACSASELSEAPKLPAGWPDMVAINARSKSASGT